MARPTYLRTCWQCFALYEASTPTQKFCSRNHSNRWRRARAEWKPCPHPFKRGLSDLDLAIDRASRQATVQHPYMCVCGCWHLATTREWVRYSTRTRRLIEQVKDRRAELSLTVSGEPNREETEDESDRTSAGVPGLRDAEPAPGDAPRLGGQLGR